VLRNSFTQPETRARISAVYNLFAFSCLIPLLFILPRLTDSLHPGNGGNPGFNSYDLDGRMRLVFYPAVLAFALLGFWLANLYARMQRISQFLQNRFT
jgi:heme exporter protein C